MAPPFPSPVATWHHSTYPSLNPKRPEISPAGKTIVITGAGQGIGREITRQYGLAGAKDIHIISRTKAKLEETKAVLNKEAPNVNVHVHPVDVTDETAMAAVAKEVGSWDVVVANAGYFSKKSETSVDNLEEWWKSWEINVKGGFVTAKVFLPTRKPGAALIGFSTGAVSLPLNFLEGASAYVASKLALVKFLEFLSAETPDLQVMILHPGIVKTDMAIKSESTFETYDDVELAGQFVIWSASKEAAFARGRMIWINWDVDELKKDTRFEDPTYLTIGLTGWPFA